jgi:hypothetical protein
MAYGRPLVYNDPEVACPLATDQLLCIYPRLPR